MLKIAVENRQNGQPIGQKEIPLTSFVNGKEDDDEIDQMQKDKKFNLYTMDNKRKLNTEIRLKLHWIYSKINLLEDLRL